MAVSWKIVMPKGKFTKEGKGRLHLQIIIDRKKKIKSLGIAVFPTQFLADEQKVCFDADKHMELSINAILQKEVSIVESNYYKCLLDEQEPSFAMLLNPNKKNTKGDFYAYYEDKIKEDSTATKATKYKWKRTLALLKEFKKQCCFKDLNLSFVKKFDSFLFNQGFATNTRGKHHCFLRRFIYNAVHDKIIKENPYQSFRLPSAQTVRTFLDADELKKLIELYEENVLTLELQNILRQFLFFSMAGGVRVCDWCKIEHSNIVGKNLVFQPQKTKKTRMLLSIPLNSLALKLVKEGNGTGNQVFATISAQKTNKQIKNIAAFANIEKKVTCHVARHTFATIFLSMGGKVEVLKEIMGHSKIETTMIYVHISEEQKRSQIALMDKLWQDYPRKATYVLADE